MAKRKDTREEVNVTVISWVTRRLIAGPDEIFAERIARSLDIRLNTKKSEGYYIALKGSPDKNRIAEKLIRELDQHAALTARNEAITTVKQIKKEHYDLIRPHFERMLNEALASPTETNSVAEEISYKPEAKGEIRNGGKEPPVNSPDPTDKAGGKEKKRRVISVKFNDAAFQPRNLSQAITYLACKDLKNSYVYAAGPFGGGKTYTPLRAGLEGYNEGLIDEIILIRPSASTGRDPGAMPGNARAKMDPYLKGGLASNIEKITTTNLAELEKRHVVRAMTPDFERGESYDRAFILVDEPQNLTMQQAELLVGRLGEGSIMVFAGDIGGNQNDLKGQMPGLIHLIATQASAALTNSILKDATAFIRFRDEDSAARNKILPHVANAINNPPDEYAGLMAAFNGTVRDARTVEAIAKARDFALSRLDIASNATKFRYESDLQKRFPDLYKSNRDAFSERPNLKAA